MSLRNKSHFSRNKVSASGIWSFVKCERFTLGNHCSSVVTGLVSVIVTLLFPVILLKTFLQSVSSGIIADNWLNVPII